MSRFEASARVQKFWLAVECGTLFVVLPVAYTVGLLPVTILLLLIVMAAGCWWVLRRRHETALHNSLRTEVPGLEWRRTFIIYAAAVPCLVCLLWLTKPATLFSLVTTKTGIATPNVAIRKDTLTVSGIIFGKSGSEVHETWKFTVDNPYLQHACEFLDSSWGSYCASQNLWHRIPRQMIKPPTAGCQATGCCLPMLESSRWQFPFSAQAPSVLAISHIA